MEPAVSTNLLQQYGAAGLVAAGLLSLMIWIVKRLVDAMIAQNKLLGEHSTNLLHALNDLKTAMLASQHATAAQVRELHMDVASVLNDVTNVGRRFRPRSPTSENKGG